MKKYRGTGLKLTPQRLAILDYLDGNKEHPSAEDIYKAVSGKFPTMSFATVYNTLEVLGERGLVSAITIDPAKKRFDPDPTPHHHLVCLACKRVIDIHRDFSLSLADSEREDFDVLGSHIEFYGLCPKCRKTDESQRR